MTSLYQLEKIVVTSFAQQQGSFSSESDMGEYVFAIDIFADRLKLAASVSDNTIGIYDTSTMSLLSKLSGHTDCINTIEASHIDPHILYSIASDKTVAVWDIRTQVPQMVSHLPGEETLALSVGMDDKLLSASTDTSILFYDIRAGVTNYAAGNKRANVLGQYDDMHSDLICQLKFNRSNPVILSSAAEDGLICVYNMSTFSADDAVVSILNTECPVRKFGYFGPTGEGVYALSTVESASFWHYPSSQRVTSFPDIRATLGVDYLVDCFSTSTASDPDDKLYLLGGTYSGNAVVTCVEPSGLSGASQSNAAHSATIRCCCPLPGGRLATGGEDARLSFWRQQGGTAGTAADRTAEDAVGNNVFVAAAAAAAATNNSKSSVSNINNNNCLMSGGGSNNSKLKMSHSKGSSAKLRAKPY